VGSFPTADFATQAAAHGVGRADRLDLRSNGTGNPGALNAAKVLGAKWGLAVLAGDIGKGALASALGRRVAGGDGAYIAGIGAVAGHCFPVWNRFRGGKGVATSAGTCAVCFPVYMPIDVGLAAASALVWRGKAELATYIASATFSAAAVLWYARQRRNAWGPPATLWLPIYAVSTSAIIAYKFVTARPPSSPQTASVAADDIVAGETVATEATH
jgi:acyl phosphate:glycerol-3-phosphate acyltransferase